MVHAEYCSFIFASRVSNVVAILELNIYASNLRTNLKNVVINYTMSVSFTLMILLDLEIHRLSHNTPTMTSWARSVSLNANVQTL